MDWTVWGYQGAESWGRRVTTDFALEPSLKMDGALPLLPLYIFTASTARTLPFILRFMGSLQKIQFFSITVTRCVMTGMRTEKHVVRQSRHPAKVRVYLHKPR